MGNDNRWKALRQALACDDAPRHVEVKALVDPRSWGATGGARKAARRWLRVHFVDTAQLDLARLGLIVRVREFDSGRADLTVKLRRPGGFVVGDPVDGSHTEIDALPGSVAWTLALKRQVPVDEVREALADPLALIRMADHEQRHLTRSIARGVDLSALRLLGPIEVTRAPARIGGARASWERWDFADGPRIVEISTRCRAGEARRVAAATLSDLNRRGVALAPRQRLKTRVALRHLARGLDPR